MNNDNIVIRLKDLMNHLRMNPSTFSKELGYSSPEKINRLLRSEGAKPSFEIIYDIANKFADTINAEWLILGVGKMLKTKEDNADVLTGIINEKAPSYGVKSSCKICLEKDKRIADLLSQIARLDKIINKLTTQKT